MTQYLIVTISNTKPSTLDVQALSKQLDKGLDWIQYSPGCFIVKTTSTASKWYARLKPVLGTDFNYFICKVDLSERQGWLPKTVWDWIRKQQLSPTTVIITNMTKHAKNE